MGAHAAKTKRSDGKERRTRASLAVLAAFCALVTIATAARAQDPDQAVSETQAQLDQAQAEPGEACAERAEQDLGCDTDYTPIAKDGEGLGWTQWAGAVHPDARPPSGYEDTIQNDNAPIPPTVDFYTVNFANQSRGLAGGAQCQEDPPAELLEDELTPQHEADLAEFLDTCVRVPVIYRYSDNTELGPIWQEAYKGDSPGFVGAITWLHNTNVARRGLRALAVGGSGSPGPGCPKSETAPPYPDADNASKPAHCGGYPRREPAIPEGKCPLKADELQTADVNPAGRRPLANGFFDSGTIVTQRDLRERQLDCDERWRREHDPAGEGRAWLLTDNRWRDLGRPGDGLPARMRGMTALDASLDTSVCGGLPTECAMAGGLQQIWRWTNEGFDPNPWEPDPPPDAPASKRVNPQNCVDINGSSPLPRGPNCREWHFRVRAIRFKFDPFSGTPAVTAVTAGCCSSHSDSQDYLREVPAGMAAGSPPPASIVLTYARGTENWSANARLSALADSIYAAAVARQPNATSFSYVAAAGGPQRPGEPPSQITPGDQASGLAGYSISSARLVAGDGGLQSNQAQFGGYPSGAQPPFDYYLDWAVGGSKKSWRALAYTTTNRPCLATANNGCQGHGIRVFPLKCPGGKINQNDPSSTIECEPDHGAPEQTKSGSLLKLSSYFLNGFAMAGNSGIGWGVGDRGAIARLAGDGAAADSTLPPENAPDLGPKRPGPAPASDPYRESAPELSDDPGVVPGRAAGEVEELNAPRIASYGSPHPQGIRRFPNLAQGIDHIAMSRDGTEGWATGPEDLQGGTTTTLYHFAGGRWRNCGTETIEGAIEADPACEALRPLKFHLDQTGHSVKIEAMARVPLENGTDPTEADDFELVAMGSPDASGRRPALRYRDGRWAIDEEWTDQLNPRNSVGFLAPLGRVTDIAFSAPNDGWMTVDPTIGDSSFHLYHYDGERWARCGDFLGAGGGSGGGDVDATECRDHNRLVPANPGDTDMHLTAAGERLYFYANRNDTPRQSSSASSGPTGGDIYPVVLYKDPGPCEQRGDSGCWQPAYDPGCVRQEPDPVNPNRIDCIPDRDPLKRGRIYSLSVALGHDGSYNGWGLGRFNSTNTLDRGVAFPVKTQRGATETALLHATDASGTEWAPVPGDDAANHVLLPAARTIENAGETNAAVPPAEIVAQPGEGGRGMVTATFGARRPIVWLDPAAGKWRMVPLPWCVKRGFVCPATDGEVVTIAPDSAGGLWIAGLAPAGTTAGGEETYLYRFSKRVPPEVFSEVPHPIRESMPPGADGSGESNFAAATASAGSGDGSFWVATTTNVLYRYERQTGWARITIPGWDRGQVVTNPSRAYAIALGPDGTGVVVGKQGRIANIGPGGAVLDPAAGILCATRQNEAPCGSGRDLRAASVALDGSGAAMVGGDDRALLYRSGAGNGFHAINPPPTALFTNITGISLPSTDRAWVVTEAGEIWGGRPEGVGSPEGVKWTWEREDTDQFGDSLSRDELRHPQPLWAIAMDASGHGYAVGAVGTILERTGEGSPPWRRVDADLDDDLYSVTLGPRGKGALIGGDLGVILTEAGPGRFEPARFADRYHPVNFGPSLWASRISGVALLAGPEDGQVEAWATSQVPAVGRPRTPAILHYSNDSSEPLLDGVAKGAESLGDYPPPAPERLSLAAFGNSDCLWNFSAASPCPELAGSQDANQLIALRVRDEIIARAGRPRGIDFGLFTGDVGSVAGSERPTLLGTPLQQSAIHDRWRELVAEPLGEAGVPLFGALGPRDLGVTASTCQPPPSQTFCYVSADESRSGVNAGWRGSMARMPAPWGTSDDTAKGSRGLSFVPVDTGSAKVDPCDLPNSDEHCNQTLEDPTKSQEGTTIEDPTKEVGGQPYEDPTEPMGGTCVEIGTQPCVPEGGALGDGETPEDGVVGDVEIAREGAVGDQRIPTGGAHTHYALDVVRDGKPILRLVVLDTSLRSIAASNHNQNPVEEQLAWLREALKRPEGERAVVLTSTPTYSYGPGALSDTLAEGTALESILIENRVDLVVDGRLGWNALYYALAPGLHFPEPGGDYPVGPPPETPGGVKPVPFLISHTAGGKFGPRGEVEQGSAADGFWRGYSIVHLDTETGEVEIEQRPVFDWIAIRPASQAKATHVLRPNQKLALEGFGREVLGIDTGPRYAEISTPAITHRFELLVADPDKPWTPKRDEGSSDNASEYRSPASKELEEEDPCGPYLCLAPSVGTIDHQSGQVRAGRGDYPRTFAIAHLSVGEQKAVYPVVFEPRSSFRTPAPGRPSPVLPPPPSAPKQPPIPSQPSVEPPQPPATPNIEQPLSINPVIPPTPPSYGNATPIDLGLAPVAIVAPPPTVVLQPPNPVVQPAPPSGARREARQRQAATQKSGAAEAARDEGVDLAGDAKAPEGAAATRHEHHFTANSQADQPSAWVRGLLYGGGLTLFAFCLAIGFNRARPTPRRRPPDVPAAAYARARRERS